MNRFLVLLAFWGMVGCAGSSNQMGSTGGDSAGTVGGVSVGASGGGTAGGTGGGVNCVPTVGDDYPNTLECAAPLTPPVKTIDVRNDFQNDYDWFRFTAQKDHYYWCHCGTDDPICPVKVFTQDGTLVGQSRTFSSPSFAYESFSFKAPNDGPLFIQTSTEMLKTAKFSLSDVGADDYPLDQNPFQPDGGTQSVSLQYENDQDTLAFSLPLGQHTLTVSPRAKFSSVLLFQEPFFTIVYEGANAGNTTLTQTFTTTTDGGFLLKFMVINPSDMSNAAPISFTLQ